MIEADECGIGIAFQAQRLVGRGLGDGLQTRIEGGVDPQPAAEDLLGAKLIDERLLDVLDEVRGNLIRLTDRLHLKRYRCRLRTLRRSDVAELRHLAQHHVSTLLRRGSVLARVVPAGRLDDPGEECSLGQIDRAHSVTEVPLGRGFHAVGPLAEVHQVQVGLEDQVLARAGLELEGQQRLTDLALERSFTVGEQEFHDLLGDRATALRVASRLGVDTQRTRDRFRIDTAVLVEPLVLDGHDSFTQAVRHGAQGNVGTILLAVPPGELGPVGRIDDRGACGSHRLALGAHVRECLRDAEQVCTDREQHDEESREGERGGLEYRGEATQGHTGRLPEHPTRPSRTGLVDSFSTPSNTERATRVW